MIGRDHGHAGLAVEEDFLHEAREAVGLVVVLQIEAHVAHELGPAKAQRAAVGEVRLDIDDEVLALRVLLRSRGRLQGLRRVDLPVRAVNHVARHEQL